MPAKNNTYALIFISIVALWLIYFLVIFSIADQACNLTIEVMGQVGDSFGPINALFSGLAFAAILISLYKQGEEISAVKKNNEYQNFISGFNALLARHLENLSQIEIMDGSNSILKGRGALKHLCEKWLSKDLSSLPQHETYRYFNCFHDEYFHVLHPHFYSLYHLLSFLHAHTSETQIAFKCRSVLKTTVSTAECGLLVFYATSEFSPNEDFVELIQLYEILENIADETEIETEILKKFTASAYGKNPIRYVLYPGDQPPTKAANTTD